MTVIKKHWVVKEWMYDSEPIGIKKSERVQVVKLSDVLAKLEEFEKDCLYMENLLGIHEWVEFLERLEKLKSEIGGVG